MTLENNRYNWAHYECCHSEFCAVLNLTTFYDFEKLAAYIKTFMPSTNVITTSTWSIVATLLSQHPHFVGINPLRESLLQIVKPAYTRMKDAHVTAFEKLEEQANTLGERDKIITLIVLKGTVLPLDIVRRILHRVLVK